MQEYLVFRLYGQLSSWGDIAVGESRHSFAYPTKSAIIGLIAAALGIRREEDDRHRTLMTAYGFGVKVLAMGTLLQDYHTTQVPPEQRKKRYYTRREELSVAKQDLKTILSSREYRCDALSIVALWQLKDDAPYSLEQIVKALDQPYFTLYLGRKSCPLSLPVKAQVIPAETLKTALDTEFPKIEAEYFLSLLKTPHYCWDENAEDVGMDRSHRIRRYDVCLSRKRWQFEAREENVCIGEEAVNVP